MRWWYSFWVWSTAFSGFYLLLLLWHCFLANCIPCQCHLPDLRALRLRMLTPFTFVCACMFVDVHMVRQLDAPRVLDDVVWTSLVWF